jgi:hypothetical protein
MRSSARPPPIPTAFRRTTAWWWATSSRRCPCSPGGSAAGSAALIHIDIGSGDEGANRSLALRLSPLLEALLQPGGLLLGDRAFLMPRCRDISADAGVPEGRYFVYRREDAA